ncbi:hypothetical protein ACFVUS_27210 [Nocardia sp. NPDC058058]|uniref:hypothetical protein n=1 Tax=Nocardia sp. NPDC058058 TaxID=3346317 RepID=UPI0036D8EE1C
MATSLRGRPFRARQKSSKSTDSGIFNQFNRRFIIQISAFLRDHRHLIWILLILFALFIFPGLIVAAANAANGSDIGESGIDALSWMNVRDSYGTPLVNYRFVADHGSVADPGAVILWTLVSLLFMIYMVIAITAIWAIGEAFSFEWLHIFSTPLRTMARAMTTMIDTPLMLVTAATAGAFFAGWFYLRGYPKKATWQVVTLIGVAVLGPMFLADPLSDVLSSDGLLMQGRDLGISVAAGLNGDSDPIPAQVVPRVEGELATNLVRGPVQIWSLGRVVDSSQVCRNAWSTGNDKQIRAGLEICDRVAYERSRTIGLGQVGTGLVLLPSAGLELWLALLLALRVVKAGTRSIGQGFAIIAGFTVGGFIYGPTQTFLVRSLVDSLVAAAEMTAYMIFLGFYMMFLGEIFKGAEGHTMSVLITAAVVEFVAISQLQHLSAGIRRGNDWIANRFAVAIQNGVPRTADGSAGGGNALGMGAMRAGGSAGSGLIPKLGMLNTINSSPVAAWLAGGVVSPFLPLSRQRRRMDKRNIAAAEWNALERDGLLIKAGLRADVPYGPRTDLAVANILDGFGDSQATPGTLIAALVKAGATQVQANQALRASAVARSSRMKSLEGVSSLQSAVAAALAVNSHNGNGDPRSVFASHAVVAADNFARHARALTPPGPFNPAHQPFVDMCLDATTSLDDLRAITPAQWHAVGFNTRIHIGNQLALQHQTLAKDYHSALTAFRPNQARIDGLRGDLLNSAMRMSAMHSGNPLSPWHHP